MLELIPDITLLVLGVIFYLHLSTRLTNSSADRNELADVVFHLSEDHNATTQRTRHQLRKLEQSLSDLYQTSPQLAGCMERLARLEKRSREINDLAVANDQRARDLHQTNAQQLTKLAGQFKELLNQTISLKEAMPHADLAQVRSQVAALEAVEGPDLSGLAPKADVEAVAATVRNLNADFENAVAAIQTELAQIPRELPTIEIPNPEPALDDLRSRIAAATAATITPEDLEARLTELEKRFTKRLTIELSRKRVRDDKLKTNGSRTRLGL